MTTDLSDAYSSSVASLAASLNINPTKIDFSSSFFDPQYSLQLPYSVQTQLILPNNDVTPLKNILQCSWMCENSIDDQIKYYIATFANHPSNPSPSHNTNPFDSNKDHGQKNTQGVFLQDRYDDYTKSILGANSLIPLFIPPPTKQNLLPSILANKLSQPKNNRESIEKREPIHLLNGFFISKKKIFWKYLVGDEIGSGNGILIAYDQQFNLWVENVNLQVPIPIVIGNSRQISYLNRHHDSIFVSGKNLISIFQKGKR